VCLLSRLPLADLIDVDEKSRWKKAMGKLAKAVQVVCAGG